jgi:4'-phosphopantetheinyl transferase
MLKVYQMDIAPLRDAEVYAEKFKQVRQGRQKKLCSLHAPDDRCRGLAAGLLLAEALEKEGISYRDASFGEGINGKPFLRGHDLFFSLTHTGELAVCVLSDCEVGADIEQLSRFDRADGARLDRIARRIMTEEEGRLWRKDPTGEALVHMWTKKESCAKYTGAGLACDLASIDTIHDAVFVHPAVPEGYDLCVCTSFCM